MEQIKKENKIGKISLTFLLCFFLLICFRCTIVNASGSIYYSGEYKRTINKENYYISMNEYTSGDTKMVGCFYIFAGKEKKDLFEYDHRGQFYEIKTNVYRYKTKKGSLTFKVKNKKMKVIQKGDVISGVNLGGTYKCTKKYTPS